MKEKKKGLSWRSMVAVLLLLGATGTALQQPAFWQWLITSSLQTIEDKTGWQIVTSRVLIKPFNGLFRLEYASVHGADGELILSADAFEGNFSLVGSLVERAWVFDSIRIERPTVVFRIRDDELKKMEFSKNNLPPDILDEIPFVRSREISITQGEGVLEVLGENPVKWTLKGAQLNLRGDDDSEHLEGDLNFDSLSWKTKKFTRVYRGQSGLVEVDVANVLHPDEIRLKDFEVQGSEGAVKVSGSFGFLPAWEPNYQLTVQTLVDLEDLFSQAPMVAPIAGKANVELTWLGEANTPPKLKGKAFVKALEIDGRKIGTLDIDYKGSLKSLDITDGHLKAGGTTFNLFGDMTLKRPYNFSLDVVADKISLYQVLDDLGVSRPWVELLANIHVHGQGHLTPRFSFKGQSTGTLNNFVVYSHDARQKEKPSQTLSVPVVSLNSAVEMTPEYFEFIDASLVSMQTRIRTDARFYFKGSDGLDIEATSPLFNFQSIENEIAGLDFLGEGQVWARVKGSYDDLKIFGNADLKQFRFENYRIGNVATKLSYINKKLVLKSAQITKGRSNLRGKFSLHFKSKGKYKKAPLLMSADFKIFRGYVEDLQNIIPMNPSSGAMDVIKSLPLSGAIQGRVKFSGNIAGGRTRFMTGEGRLFNKTGTRLLRQGLTHWSAAFDLNKDAFELTKFQGVMGGGKIGTQLVVLRDEGSISGTLDLKNVRLSQLDINRELPQSLLGQLNFEGTIKGQAKNPLVTGKTTWQAAGLGPMRFGNLHWDLSVRDKELLLAGTLWKGQGHFNGLLGLKSPFSFKVGLQMKSGPLTPQVWPEVWSPTGWGIATGGMNASWSGSVRHLENTRGMIESKEMIFIKDQRQYQSKGNFAVRTVGKSVHFDQVNLTSVTGENLALKGFFNSNRLEMYLNGDLNASLVGPYIPKVKDLTGDLSFRIGLTGQTSKPRVTGKGRLSKGKLSMTFFPDVFENVEGAFILKGRELSFKDMTANASGAPVAVSGSLQHQGASPSFYDIAISYNNWEGQYPSWLNSKSDGRLRIVGAARQPTLTGEIMIQEARYEDNLDGDEFLPEFKNRLKKIQSYQKEEEGLKLDIHLVADKNLYVQNNLVNAELKADLFVTGTEERIGLRGIVQSLRGQANVRGNRYQILRGNIDFVETYRIAPRLDIEAETRIKDYDVTASMLGPMDDLRIKFDSRPKLSEIDVLSLVTLGFTQRELKDAAGTAGAAGLEMVSAYTGLDKELKRLIPSSIADTEALSLDELRLTTAFSERDGSNVPAVVMGVELFDGMRLRIQSTLLEDASGDTEQKMELEQRLKGKLRWRLVWDSAGESNLGDAGADMWYRWEF